VLAAPGQGQDPARRQLAGELVDRVAQHVGLLGVHLGGRDQAAFEPRSHPDPQRLQLGQLGHAAKIRRPV
jgi:hypothetical protein